MKLIGEATNPPQGTNRVPTMIHPDVRKRLNRLLNDNPEMFAVGYSEFINRACEIAEREIVRERQERQEVAERRKEVSS